MTLKEAVLISLEDLKKITNYSEVCNHIISNNYYDFGSAKTPSATVSALLGDFIRSGDSRVKRIKIEGGAYNYFLTKNEDSIGGDLSKALISSLPTRKILKTKTYEERKLHKLLSSYLKSTGIYSKTIFHEQSTFGRDSNQIWSHPDMVGIRFLNLQTKASRNFLKAVNQVDTFKISSYEIKKEINSDSDLKKAYFQAVSNSSWANYGYLVAFEISDTLTEEMDRLNQSFGIGVIELNPNPYQSKILLPAKYRDLDFQTIDKLCKMNKDFEKFIEQTEKLMTAEERYYRSTEKELDEFSDDYFLNDSEVEEYCAENFLPSKH